MLRRLAQIVRTLRLAERARNKSPEYGNRRRPFSAHSNQPACA